MNPLLLGDVYLWPYHAGNTLVDIILYGVWVFLFGLFFTWGQRVGSKLP